MTQTKKETPWIPIILVGLLATLLFFLFAPSSGNQNGVQSAATSIASVTPIKTRRSGPTTSLATIIPATSTLINPNSAATIPSSSGSTPIPTSNTGAPLPINTVRPQYPQPILLYPSSCTAGDQQFKPNSAIEFKWLWSGTLSGEQYLEIRVGSETAVKGGSGQGWIYTSNQVAARNGDSWSWTISTDNFYQPGTTDYRWAIAYMDKINGTPVLLSLSLTNCLQVVPNGAGNSPISATPTPGRRN